MGWYIWTDPECCLGPHETREEAIEAGKTEWGGGKFLLSEGEPFKLQAPSIEDWLPDAFDDANADYTGPDAEGASYHWHPAHIKEIVGQVDKLITEWIVKHGYNRGWALNLAGEEEIRP